MPQSLSKVYLHVIFSTKNRFPFIDETCASELFKYLAGVCNNQGCPVLQVGGHRDHVHIFCQLARTLSQSDLVKELKINSSKWMKARGGVFEKFYWQDGYGIFSINPTQTAAVVEYIKNQAEHHKTRSFQDEFRAFLQKYGVEYDERYVWD